MHRQATLRSLLIMSAACSSIVIQASVSAGCVYFDVPQQEGGWAEDIQHGIRACMFLAQIYKGGCKYQKCGGGECVLFLQGH